MPLEDKGVSYAMSKSDVTKEDYAKLGDFTCTRGRLFQVDPKMGVFNKNTHRAYSKGEKNVHPRAEHDESTYKPKFEKIEFPNTRNGWPPAVKGGHIIDFITPSDNPHRKAGGLPRNIVGDVTVKDQYRTYYGPDSTYYGGNVGSRNRKLYENRFEKDPF